MLSGDLAVKWCILGYDEDDCPATRALPKFEAERGTVSLACDVSSDEPSDDGGDGNTEPDYACTVRGGVVDLSLRAERQGTSFGRTYTVMITASDPSGNASVASCDVVAPHDRGNKK